MEQDFFKQPILNSPYEYPARHWELDKSGQPTGNVLGHRRDCAYITPIPKPRRQRNTQQLELVFEDDLGLSSAKQEYDPVPIINELRHRVDRWRALPDPNTWRVTPETARLLQHWRHHAFSDVRPFFCQIEAVETVIWLTEVAPTLGNEAVVFTKHLTNANDASNPGLERIALKLATGAGKTTVMAMLIAWQTINAVRRPNSPRFTRGFLVITPGITIKDRLRVLLPNDPDSYFSSRELIPSDMQEEVLRARVVITNYHAFKRRERFEISSGGRALLRGRTGQEPVTLESEGQMLQRVLRELMSMKHVMVLNDEGHHCYRRKPGDSDEGELKGDDREEAVANENTARLWISGIEAIQRRLGRARVVDLSATPFFLRGSGYAEGTLFPWTMSDFSLMDAIECGIVKLPRVPVADNIPGADVPVYRNLWEHIRHKMPRKGRGKAAILDPRSIPVELQTALEALYGHYVKTFELWQRDALRVPPCFIIVCNNTSASKLVYDYVSGFQRTNEDGSSQLVGGQLPLFRNHDDYGNPLARPNTVLIDSEQLESGEALDAEFRKMAADEIERFRREIKDRTGDAKAAEGLTDADLLREVMNTVGKAGRLGESVRCVVSVSMLTEGWDANTVTHVLGVRAFGTQLLCEQVIGRALRRQSYELNDGGLFAVEYADVLGIPFDFNAKPVVAPAQPPRETIHVKAMRPERDHLEIRFPRVQGYRVEPPRERLEARFDASHELTLTPDLVGPTTTRNSGLIGEAVDLDVQHLADTRASRILFFLTTRLMNTKWRDANEDPRLYLFGELKRITKQWLDTCLTCIGGTYPAQLLYQELADMACERITAGITLAMADTRPVVAVLDTYNPTGSTMHVSFRTSKPDRWETDARRCHVNWVILDSGWEAEFCRVVEARPRVRAYVKNHNLGFEVPYRFGSETRRYLPDFIVLVDDGHGDDDLLRLVIEIKGYRREDANDKKNTMLSYWIPGVNSLRSYGRWAFAELDEVFAMEEDFAAQAEGHVAAAIERAVASATV